MDQSVRICGPIAKKTSTQVKRITPAFFELSPWRNYRSAPLDHRLRGNAALSCVNGDWLCQWESAIFDPLQNRHVPSTDHQKFCHRWLFRRPLWLCQIRCISVHWGLLGTWVKYNQNYFYLCLFSKEITYRSDPSTNFRTTTAQTTRPRARMCVLGNFSHCSPLRGSKAPRKTNFGAWIGVSSQTREIEKRASYQNYCIDSKQILQSDKDHQAPFVGGPHTRITNPSWKNRKHVISEPRLERFWRNLARGCSSTVRPSRLFRPLKIRNF